MADLLTGQLDGRVALVTGGSRGIGLEIAQLLAAGGASLAINYLKDQAAADSALRLLGNTTRVVVVQGDVAKKAEVNEMIDQVLEEFGQIDVVVNNAGWTQPQFVLDTTEADWDRMIDVHLKGAFNMAQAVLPHMMERRSGVIINISSVVGRTGQMGAGVHYCAAKAGLQGLTRALANQVAPYGIRVNAVAPGMTDTPMIRWRTPEQLREHLEMVPLGRVGQPEEVATTVAFLCTDRAGYTTGEVVDVNGGLFML